MRIKILNRGISEKFMKYSRNMATLQCSGEKMRVRNEKYESGGLQGDSIEGEGCKEQPVKRRKLNM